MPRFQILLLLDLCPPRHLKQAGTAPTPQPRTNKRQVFPHRPSVFRRNAAVCSTPETQSWLFIIAMISLETVRSRQASHSYVSIPHPLLANSGSPKATSALGAKRTKVACAVLVLSVFGSSVSARKVKSGLPRRFAVGLPPR